MRRSSRVAAKPPQTYREVSLIRTVTMLAVRFFFLDKNASFLKKSLYRYLIILFWVLWARALLAKFYTFQWYYLFTLGWGFSRDSSSEFNRKFCLVKRGDCSNDRSWTEL